MIFVTGGTGFVGAHLLYHLASGKEQVLALKRETSNTDYTKAVFDVYEEDSRELFDRIEWVEGDVLDYEALKEYTRQADTIYHVAAMVSFESGHRKQMLHTNIQGTANVVNAALENGVERLVYVSSVAALDPPKGERPVDEQQFGNFPTRYSAYAESKFQSELEVWRGVEEGLSALVVNPSIIIGPMVPLQGPGGLFKTLRKGMSYYPTGVTGFVDVRDVVRAMLELSDRKVTNDRFILSQGNHSYQEMFRLIARAFNSKVPKKKLPPWVTAVAWRLEGVRAGLMGGSPRITREIHESAHRRVYFSNEKLVQTLDYQYVPIEQSVEDTVRFFDRLMN
jgi:nucleoside-diphosphate-sugar epimerase